MNEFAKITLGEAAPAQAMTIGARLSGPFARHNAFDSIRLFAAVAVLVSHAFVLTSGTSQLEPLFALTGGQMSLGHAAVAVFFVLSGLLISMSFDRSSSVFSFARKRALRIMPALCVATLLSVLVLGPLITTLPLSGYLTDRETFTYVANMIFLPDDYKLPGVFVDNPYSGIVNGSLWTLRYEVACYAAAALLLALPHFRRTIVVGCWLGSIVAHSVLPPAAEFGGLSYHLVTLADLFQFFGAGIIAYLWRDQIPCRPGVAALAATALGVALFTPFVSLALATFGAYAIVVAGLMASNSLKTMTGGRDLSYGVYIFAFPVQQMVVMQLGQVALPWAANIAVALPITFTLAYLSWILVERPAMDLNHRWGTAPQKAQPAG